MSTIETLNHITVQTNKIKEPKVIFRTWTLMGISHIIIVLLFTNFLNTKLNGIGYATIISQWLSLIYIIIENHLNILNKSYYTN